MRFFKTGSIVGVMALCLSAGFALAGNSPAYDSWAKLKPGSSVTLKTTAEAAGQKSETETTYVLDEVTADKAVVEVKMSMVASGNKIDLPGRKMDIPKGTTTATPAPKPANPTPTPNVKTSEETVTISGKPYKCQVTEVTNDANGTKSTSKTWMSDEVPNLLVKSESSTTGAVSAKAVMEVTKIEVK
jgi:hypothetical protein